jgi:hypothetical protein
MFSFICRLFGFNTDDYLFKPYTEVKSISEAYDVAVKNVINQHIQVVLHNRGEVSLFIKIHHTVKNFMNNMLKM